jgi:hypothetical protein
MVPLFLNRFATWSGLLEPNEWFSSNSILLSLFQYLWTGELYKHDHQWFMLGKFFTHASSRLPNLCGRNMQIEKGEILALRTVCRLSSFVPWVYSCLAMRRRQSFCRWLLRSVVGQVIKMPNSSPFLSLWEKSRLRFHTNRSIFITVRRSMG